MAEEKKSKFTYSRTGFKKEDSAEGSATTNVSTSGSTVHCLCVDLIGSTEFGLSLTVTQRDRFNLALINQLTPHLEEFDLEKEVVKFTGDGWLVMTNKTDHIFRLGCLSLIMAKRFQKEIGEAASIEETMIPKLRIAICSGRDIKVPTPQGGNTDWVGDSARRARRASDYCEANMILIDEIIKMHAGNDFKTSFFDKEKSPNKPKHSEEEFTLYQFNGLSDNVAKDPNSPKHYIYTQKLIGQEEKAKHYAQKASEDFAEKAQDQETEKDQLLIKWNNLLKSNLKYEEAVEIFWQLQASELKPDVSTYSSLINKAPKYSIALDWMTRMKEDGILPNVDTYNTLIILAPDYEEAEKWLARMKEDQIAPNVATYNTFINLAPDYEEAEKWLAQMKEDGINPNIVSYNALINLAPDEKEVERWEAEMKGAGIDPDTVEHNDLITWLDYFSAAYKATNENNYLKAEAYYKIAIKLKPDFANTYNNLGLLLARDESSWNDAEKAFRKAITLDFHLPEAYLNLADLLRDQGRIEEAKENYKEALKRDPKLNDASSNLLKVLFKQGDFDGAIKIIKKLSSLIEFYKNPLIGLALLFKKKGDVDKFKFVLEKAKLSINEGDHYSIAALNAVSGNNDEAISSLKSAISKNYKYRDRARSDSSFESLSDDPRFWKIVGKEDS